MNLAIILSGGVGTRMGINIPKQYIEVNKKPILQYSVETFSQRTDIDLIIIGIADQWKEYAQKHLSEIKTPIYYSEPGRTRQFTIYNALLKAKELGCDKEATVIIHDAARPLVTHQIIDNCLNGIKEGYDGVLPVIRVKDTIYQSTDGKNIDNLLKRDELFAGQAPESFQLGKYLSIHENMDDSQIEKINGSTEIAFKAGLRIKLAAGSECNFKITTPEDLTNFEQIINKK